MDDIDKITYFLIEHNKYKDKELLKKYVKEHQGYGTLDYGIDTSGDIVAVVRYNVSDDGRIVDILDFAIHNAWRNRGIGKDFILRALNKFPKIEYLEYKRGIRGDERIRKLNIKGILKRRIF